MGTFFPAIYSGQAGLRTSYRRPETEGRHSPVDEKPGFNNGLLCRLHFTSPSGSFRGYSQSKPPKTAPFFSR